MKTISNFQVPTSWNEITISQLKSLKTVKEDASIQSYFNILNIFCPNVDILTTDLPSVVEAVTEIYKVIQTAPVPVQMQSGEYTIGDETYHVCNIEQLNFSEFIDFQNMANTTDEWDKINNLGLILSVITDKPEGTDVMKFAQRIEENVDVITGTSLLLFFSDSLTTYLQDTPIYSQYMEQIQKIRGSQMEG
jgi:hypothetical protein